MVISIKPWTNKLGATVTHGRLLLEVWLNGGVTRCVRDNSLCGFHGTHYTNVTPGTIDEMAKAAVESWKTNRSSWSECE